MVVGIYPDKSAEEYPSAKSAALSGKLGIAISLLVESQFLVGWVEERNPTLTISNLI
jgi:hypothetical protein